MGTDIKKQVKNFPLIITGMHRSGTSLVSAYLQKCGLDIGKNLLPGKPENPIGFFEDSDFVTVHQKILRKNEIWLYTPQKEMIPKKIPSDLENLVQHKQKINTTQWGWKDPRTVIFLDFYKKIIPKGCFIFLYRHPFLVIDSLIRRFSDWHIRLCPFAGARSWLWYNQEIISFIKKYPQKSILFNLGDFIKKPQESIELINNKWDLKLKPKNFRKIYKPKLLKKNKSFNLLSKMVIFIYKRKLLRFWDQLNKIKTKP